MLINRYPTRGIFDFGVLYERLVVVDVFFEFLFSITHCEVVDYTACIGAMLIRWVSYVGKETRKASNK